MTCFQAGHPFFLFKRPTTDQTTHDDGPRRCDSRLFQVRRSHRTLKSQNCTGRVIVNLRVISHRFGKRGEKENQKEHEKTGHMTWLQYWPQQSDAKMLKLFLGSLVAGSCPRSILLLSVHKSKATPYLTKLVPTVSKTNLILSSKAQFGTWWGGKFQEGNKATWRLASCWGKNVTLMACPRSNRLSPCFDK